MFETLFAKNVIYYLDLKLGLAITIDHAKQIHSPLQRSKNDQKKEKTMQKAMIEHINITVSDVDRTVAMLKALFGWTVRWQGPSKDNGLTAHIGDKTRYLALYSKGGSAPQTTSYEMPGGLNHIGIVVDDLDALERRVHAFGLKPHSHADYEPGRRFYFHDHDDIEYEIVSYE